jgi:hypothetical protein
MSKRIYLTFGGAAFDFTISVMVASARAYGADELQVYDDRWLVEQEFFRVNHWLWERQPQFGFGWYCWKPWLIRRVLTEQEPGTVVLYTDADTYPISDLTPIFDCAEREGVMLFEEQGCLNGMWTRADCWDAMGMVPQPESQHACGRFQLFRSGWIHSVEFLKAWERFCFVPECQFHEGSTKHEDAPNFIRHSAEQSILSLLALKYSIPLHRTPCQNGWPIAAGKDDWYPQLFVQDGRRGDIRDLSGSRFVTCR